MNHAPSPVEQISLPWADERAIVLSRDVRDVDAMAAHIDDGIAGEYVQLEAKPFRGHWTAVRLATCLLQFIREEVATVHRIRMPADRWVFFVPLSVPDGVRWDGHEISRHSCVVCPPSAESFVFNPGRTEFAVMSAGPDVVQHLVEIARSNLGVASGCEIASLRSRDAEAFVEDLVELRTTLEFRPDTISRERIGQVETLLQRGLHKCLSHAITGEPTGGPERSRGHVVRRAEQFFREHLGEAVSIAQLSSIAGVSERSLRNAFHHVCTTSPKKYLRIWQLHQVRHSLRVAPQGPATVTAVATQHGFYELGRFAGEYRALFGEAPSQTLSNARARPDRPNHWPLAFARP